MTRARVATWTSVDCRSLLWARWAEERPACLDGMTRAIQMPLLYTLARQFATPFSRLGLSSSSGFSTTYFFKIGNRGSKFALG
ncbi:hypothetical protein VTJ83DRAFT_4061 [Remersonia thermophila]|uniref:Secreted protein n=1 Tax=Remersonia thermophila TaxID=72144 RepID=A0ABR4DFW1_9PEZI